MNASERPACGRALLTALALWLALAAGGCATTGGSSRHAADPLEPVNRVVFSFNENLDEYLLKPVAKAYRAVLPDPVRQAISNVFGNIGDLFNIANNLLQGKPVETAESTMRVAVNTVFGLGGLIDMATAVGIQKHSEDFGQTLGVWGLGAGPYLVLPVLGPSSARDAVGTGVQLTYSPYDAIYPVRSRNTVIGVAAVDARARLLDAVDLLDQAALDKYSFVRDAYLSRRRYLVYDGNPPPEPESKDDAGANEGGPAK